MIRATRRKQTRRLARRGKVSSTRRASASGRVSSREAARHLASVPKAVSAHGKTAARSVGKPRGGEHDAALKNFETAVRYFQKKDYDRATPLFAKAAACPIREIAHRARVHLRFCESRRHQESRPKTAEGYYARGIAALNNRDFDRALQCLTKSDKMIPNQEYIHYALAAAYGLRGDSDSAFSHLERAIKLRPQNRLQARHDEDFQPLVGDPRFGQLLGAGVQRQLG